MLLVGVVTGQVNTGQHQSTVTVSNPEGQYVQQIINSVEKWLDRTLSNQLNGRFNGKYEYSLSIGRNQKQRLGPEVAAVTPGRKENTLVIRVEPRKAGHQWECCLECPEIAIVLALFSFDRPEATYFIHAVDMAEDDSGLSAVLTESLIKSSRQVSYLLQDTKREVFAARKLLDDTRLDHFCHLLVSHGRNASTEDAHKMICTANGCNEKTVVVPGVMAHLTYLGVVDPEFRNGLGRMPYFQPTVIALERAERHCRKQREKETNDLKTKINSLKNRAEKASKDRKHHLQEALVARNNEKKFRAELTEAEAQLALIQPKL